MALPRFKFVNVESIAQAAQILKENPGKAKVIGGGTDLLHGFKDNIYSEYPEVIINLRSSGNGAYVKEDAEGVHIGALTSLHTIEKDRLLNDHYQLLSEAAYTVASPQIRNFSTLGGNICQEPRCWYYRNADNLFTCMRKGGSSCPAFTGRSEIHSICGAARIKVTPCQEECPNDTPIPRYFDLIRKGNMAAAAKLFLTVNPLAAMTGRVCPHTCQGQCNRYEHDEEVSIRDIERGLGDYILEHAPELLPQLRDSSGKKIAVVGSGPAGLVAAYYLRLAGSEVVVYDSNEKAGGMLLYGIPAYRLPKYLVAKNVRLIEEMGVRFQQNVKIGRDITLGRLQEEFDAVFLGIGAWTSTALGCKGENTQGVTAGIDFLYRIANKGDVGVAGKIVGVVGGGNTAMDACRSAVRAGAKKVYNFYRRTRAEMPADEIEIAEATAEGVEFRYLMAPDEIMEQDGKVTQLKLQMMELGEADDSGRRRPIPIANAFEIIDVDLVIAAVGQGVDPAGFEAAGVTDRRWIKADSRTYATDLRGVFAAGDGAQGPATVVKAIAGARKAAAEINAYLGIKVEEVGDQEERILTFDQGCLKHSSKLVMPIKAVPERNLYDEDAGYGIADGLMDAGTRINGARINGAMDDIVAAKAGAKTPGAGSVDILYGGIRREAQRCFNCGCVAACPSDLAPALVALDAEIKTTKRTIPAEEFFAAGVYSSTILDQDELVMEIILPKRTSNQQSAYLKFRQRQAIDFPLLSVAIVLQTDGGKIIDARIVLGAAAPIPLRASAAEDYLKGKEITEETAVYAADEALKNALPLRENGYKVQVAKAYVKRAILACKK